MGKVITALIQLDSTANQGDNFKRIENLVEQAAAQGARLAALPEFAGGIMPVDSPNWSEEFIGPTTNFLSSLARRHGLWIHGGSFRESNPGRPPFNTSVFIDPAGKIRATYRKIHLFSIDIDGGPTFRESDHTSAGGEISVHQCDLGIFGFSICYDLRFPEMFRLMALSGAQAVFVPACFTQSTGPAHWECLLRARAIENGCYIIAAAQCGSKPAYQAHGHSLAVDPWGTVIAELGDGEGLCLAEIDFNKTLETRKKIPVLKNRREDVYSLAEIAKR